MGEGLLGLPCPTRRTTALCWARVSYRSAILSAIQAAEAVATLYHRWITGLVLALVARKGADAAEAFVFRLFRRQHLERFLPGLEKLGLTAAPHAVAAAKYHYFSNQLGGVKVEFLEESPRKAWVRYPPPRWMWEGTAICGIPSAVNRAMLYGWHAHNGVTLGNPRLGFVCTKTTVDGQPRLEGYYHEADRDLAEDERLQFRPEEACPPIDRERLPRLDHAVWPDERKAKANRNYALEYIRNGLPALIELLGPEEARYIGRICGLQIGMHTWDDVAPALGIEDAAGDWLGALELLLSASGDSVERDGETLHRTVWRLFPDASPGVLTDIWLAPLRGMLAVHDRFLELESDGTSFKLIPGRG